MNLNPNLKGFLTFVYIGVSFFVLFAFYTKFQLSDETETIRSSSAGETDYAPFNIKSTEIGYTTATIKWSDDGYKPTAVFVNTENISCKNDSNCKKYTNIINSDNTYKIDLLGLKPATKYFVELEKNNRYYPLNNLVEIETKKFEEEKDENGFKINNNPQSSEPENVLGVSTKSIELSDALIKEFSEAMKYNDTRYDFNKDNQVSTLDYPLFMTFVTNKED